MESNMKASVIVSYCSLDRRFLPKLLEQVLVFSDDITVVYYDKLLNGEPESVEEVEALVDASDRTKVKTLMLKYTADHSPRHFHNLARWEGMKEAKYDHLLFLDADEIPEGEVIKTILDENLLKDCDAVDFGCHWYFRSATNQAVQKEECGLLVRKDIITEKLMFTENERWSFRHSRKFKYIPRVQTQNGPFMHHFSWVRTKEEMLTKVSAWGHKHDKDWVSLINEEFSRDFNGKDFVHRYSYTQVPDKFSLGI